MENTEIIVNVKVAGSILILLGWAISVYSGYKIGYMDGAFDKETEMLDKQIKELEDKLREV